MATPSRPPAAPETEMVDTVDKAPWPINWTWRNGCTACWDKPKATNLLYVFVNKVRLQLQGQCVNSVNRDVEIQWERVDILKAMAQACAYREKRAYKKGEVVISQGSYSAYMRDFRDAGYITWERYTDTFIVHLDVIEAAFTNPPAKPSRYRTTSEKPEKPRKEHVSTVSTSSTDLVDTIEQIIEKMLVKHLMPLVEMCQQLQQSVNGVSTVCQQSVNRVSTLTQNPTIATSPQADADGVENGSLILMLNTNANTNTFFGEQVQTALAEEAKPDVEKNEENTNSSYSHGSQGVDNEAEQPSLVETASEQNDQPQSSENEASSQSRCLYETSNRPAKPAVAMPTIPETPYPQVTIPNLSIEAETPTFTTSSKQVEAERKAAERRIKQLIKAAAGAPIAQSYTGPNSPMANLVDEYLDGDWEDADITFSVKDLIAQKKSVNFAFFVNNLNDAKRKRMEGLQPGDAFAKIIPIQSRRGVDPQAQVWGQEKIDEMKRQSDRERERSRKEIEERKNREALSRGVMAQA